MKHPSSRALFGYWDDTRGNARAPDRSALQPWAVRELLGDIFVLSTEAKAGYPFRVAGTRVCALLGRELKGQGLTALFGPASRGEIDELLGLVAEETMVAVAGITAAARDGSPAHLELLLLPFQARAHAPLSLTGLLAPLQAAPSAVSDFQLTSWRSIGRPQRRFNPRALRRWSVARGFTVYEGVR
jgi:hypothetical protein